MLKYQTINERNNPINVYFTFNYNVDLLCKLLHWCQLQPNAHFSVSQIKCYWGNKYAIHISTVDNFSYNSLLILDTIFRCILIAITTYQHISFGSITGHLKNLIIPLLEYLILLKIQLPERMSLWYWRWLIINEVSN